MVAAQAKSTAQRHPHLEVVGLIISDDADGVSDLRAAIARGLDVAPTVKQFVGVVPFVMLVKTLHDKAPALLKWLHSLRPWQGRCVPIIAITGAGFSRDCCGNCES